MKEEKNIDDLFRSSFEDFEVAPPAAIKEAIDRQIDARPSRRKTWWFLLLVLLAGSGAFAYIYTTSSTSDNTPQTAQTHTGIASTQSSTPGSATNGATTGSSAPGTRAAAGSSSGSSTTPAGNTAGGTTVAGNKTVNGTTASDGRLSGADNTQNARSSTTAGKKGTSKGSKQASGKKSTSPAGGKKSGGPAASTQGSDGNGKNGNESGGNDGNKTGGDTPSGPKTNTPPVANPNAGGGENPSTPPNAPTDSVPAKEDSPKKEETLSDSTNDPATQKPKKEKKDSDAGDEQWRASVYVGPQLSWGKTTTSNEQQRLSADKSNFQLSGEINRSLFAGYGLSTGLQYSTKRTETFAWDTYVITDSTVTIEWEYIYGNPNFPDSITDSVEVEVWVYDSTGTTHTQINSISSFGIPLYITKQFTFGENWGLLVNAGAQFNFYNVKLGNDSVPVMQTVNDFGVTLIGRAHLAYQWNQWQFSAGLNTGYDLKLPIVYEGIDRRRYFVTPQIAVHFVF